MPVVPDIAPTRARVSALTLALTMTALQPADTVARRR